MFSRLKDLTFFDIVSWICMFGFANGVCRRVCNKSILEKMSDVGYGITDRVIGFVGNR